VVQLSDIWWHLTGDHAGLSNQIEIMRIYLLYSFRHNGIGNLLIDEILATARKKESLR
jgi:hypothetical protein